MRYGLVHLVDDATQLALPLLEPYLVLPFPFSHDLSLLRQISLHECGLALDVSEDLLRGDMGEVLLSIEFLYSINLLPFYRL